MVKKISEKIGIFEIREDPQVNDDTQGHHGFFPWSLLQIVDRHPDQVIREGGENKEKKKQATGLIAKIQADQEKVCIPQGLLFIQDGIYGDGQQQESPEIQPGE
jgi:hypothetical protein